MFMKPGSTPQKTIGHEQRCWQAEAACIGWLREFACRFEEIRISNIVGDVEGMYDGRRKIAQTMNCLGKVTQYR